MNIETNIFCAGLLLFRVEDNRPLEYLLVNSGRSCKDNWTPPKGLLKKNETFLEAAKRETKEETGIDSTALKIYKIEPFETTYQCRGRTKKTKYFLCKLNNNKTSIVINKREISDYFWGSLDSAQKKAKYEEMKNLLSWGTTTIETLSLKNAL